MIVLYVCFGAENVCAVDNNGAKLELRQICAAVTNLYGTSDHSGRWDVNLQQIYALLVCLRAGNMFGEQTTPRWSSGRVMRKKFKSYKLVLERVRLSPSVSVSNGCVTVLRA